MLQYQPLLLVDCRAQFCAPPWFDTLLQFQKPIPLDPQSGVQIRHIVVTLVQPHCCPGLQPILHGSVSIEVKQIVKQSPSIYGYCVHSSLCFLI
jgi:hypothetical protein